MRHKWILGIGLVIVTVPFAAIMIGRTRGAGELENQLRLARSEGIPTNGREYAAMIKSAPPEENAASIYQTLSKASLDREAPRKLTENLISTPGPRTLREAEAYIERNKATYAQIDKAVALPHCWFDRDWTTGYAVLLPEFASMKSTSVLLSLRGAVAAAKGDHDAALKEAEKIFRTAQHAGEEGHVISRLVSESVYIVGLRHLARTASLHRDHPAYRQALSQAIADYPKPDVQREHAGDMYSLLLAIDMMQTPEGRKEFGLKEEDVSSLDKVAPFVVDQMGSRVKIIEAERKLWAAYRAESPDKAVIDEARTARDTALLAFPTAADIMSKLSSGGEPDITTGQRRTIRRLEYTALLRATEGNTVPKTIETSDLLSPFDGKSIAYRFDGQAITIDVRYPPSPDAPKPLKVLVRDGKVLTFKTVTPP